MGFLSNIARGATGFMTGGFSELGRKDPFGINSPGTGGGGAVPWNPITATNTAIPKDLAGTFSAVGAGALGGIGANYNNLAQRQQQESGARMQPPTGNSYGPQRFAVQQGLDTGNLESALGGQLGSTAYNDALSNRDYQQSASTADEIARLNRPSALQEIFKGIGAVGGPVATYAGAGGFGGSGGGNIPNANGSLPPRLSLYNGYNPYGGGY